MKAIGYQLKPFNAFNYTLTQNHEELSASKCHITTKRTNQVKNYNLLRNCVEAYEITI